MSRLMLISLLEVEKVYCSLLGELRRDFSVKCTTPEQLTPDADAALIVDHTIEVALARQIYAALRAENPQVQIFELLQKGDKIRFLETVGIYADNAPDAGEVIKVHLGMPVL